MSSPSLMRDIGAYVTTVNGLTAQTVDDSTANDNAEINGGAVDRELTQAGRSLMLSGKVSIQYDARVESGETLTLTGHVQHSSVSTGGWADTTFKGGSTSISVTAGSTGSTANQTPSGTLTGDLDLGGLKRYMRLQITPNYSKAASTAATQDVDLAGQFVLGGYDTLAASTSA